MTGQPRKGGQGGRAAKAGSHRKAPTAGSGGKRRQALEGKKPTPPAEMRPGHPAQRRAAAAASAKAKSRSEIAEPAVELIGGRNPVLEALRAKVPASALMLATGLEPDPRIDEMRKIAQRRELPIRELNRSQLDRLAADRGVHQGVLLEILPYVYAHPDDLPARATGAPLLVALDGITDPRNLGAVIRSSAAFGAHGVLVPERRAAGVNAAAWKASAGAASRLPVARATNLVRALTAYRASGLFVVGLAAEGTADLDELELATDPLVLVAGSEGKGLSRLVTDTCDLTVRIPMAGVVESLNASVAVSVALAEVARRRRHAAAALDEGLRGAG
jgi:23S rRNA (guanosine2251-2'-O)-methyltransferase